MSDPSNNPFARQVRRIEDECRAMTRKDITALYPEMSEAEVDEVMTKLCVDVFDDKDIRRLATEMARQATR